MLKSRSDLEIIRLQLCLTCSNMQFVEGVRCIWIDSNATFQRFVFVSVCRTVCTVPLIDYIDGNGYSMEPQQGGDEDGLARGAWDWSLLWKRVPLSQREKAKRKYVTQPYRYIYINYNSSHFFLSPSSIPSSHSFCPSLCWFTPSHPLSLWCLLSVVSLTCTIPTTVFPVCCVCTSPRSFCQNRQYGAFDRLRPWTEVQHRGPRWRRRKRVC